jgi:hypothetical protein
VFITMRLFPPDVELGDLRGILYGPIALTSSGNVQITGIDLVTDIFMSSNIARLDFYQASGPG